MATLEDLKAYNKVAKFLSKQGIPRSDHIEYLTNLWEDLSLLLDEKELPPKRIREIREFFSKFADEMYQIIVGLNRSINNHEL